jgi:serine/threonine protein kinase
MAEIYLAKTRGIAGFEKYVALKMIHPNFSQDEQFIQMLIDEAKITVLLQHVNIAQTFDLGRVGNTYYITMEFVDGADLYKLLRKGSEKGMDVPFDVAAYVAKEAATGLDYAHRKRDVNGKKLGIVHRDVSPQNVLISFNGEVKLVDFGIAKATMKSRQTAAGVIKGKYYYMSPEQAWGEPVDHRTDVFSTGILLYEMITGQMLYLEEDLHKLLAMVREADIEPPSTLRPDVPPQLEKITMRALGKNREDRYQSANDLATDLERFLHAYSPVFRAQKVARWIKEVLDEMISEVEAGELPSQPEPYDAFRVSVTEEQLVRERSEIHDENSMIFNVQEFEDRRRAEEDAMARASTSKPRDPDEGTREVDRPAQFPGAKSASGADRRPLPNLPRLGAAAREPHQETHNVGAAELMDDTSKAVPLPEVDEESTVISDAPSFASGHDLSAFESAPRGRNEQTKEAAGLPRVPNIPPIATQPKFVDNVRTIPDAVPPSMAGMPVSDDNDEGPTIRRPKPVAKSQPVRQRKKTVPPPIPPAALAASNPEPAVSLAKKRRSRRTPPGGTPSQGPSVLEQLVNRGGGPAAGLAGMPITRDPADGSGMGPGGPGPAPGSSHRPGPGPGQIPGPGGPGQIPGPGGPGGPNLGGPGPFGPGGPSPLPVGAQAQMPGGFNHQGSDGTTTPYDSGGFPLIPQGRSPFGQLPPGAPPLSTANRLAALEVDDIPDAFKLSTLAAKRRKRFIVGVVALVVCVMAGVGLGILLFGGGGGEPKAKSIEVVSIPTGAKVLIDGKEQDGKTPFRFTEVALGETYLIEVQSSGYKPWSNEVAITAKSSDVVKVIARLDAITVKLKVESKPKGAKVLINGNPIGVTPLTLEDLDPKTAKSIELQLKGYRPIRQDLDWADATEKTLSFEMKK